MSAGNSPTPPSPHHVVVVSHSPFVYLWPVWAVGFIAAAWTFAAGDDVAFVPRGTVAERDGRVEGFDGRRDVLIAPAGRSLPESPAEFGIKQPRFRMTLSNNLGIIWALTLCVTLIVTHVQVRRMRSVILIAVLLVVAIVFAFMGWWDPVVRAIQFLEIHMTATGYLSISLLLLIIWVLMYWVYDRQMAMTFSPGQVRVRTALGGGETTYDTRGMVVTMDREALIRHWLLGFGSGDLTVQTAGAKPVQFQWPNVFGIRRKVEQINAMVDKPEIVKAQ